MANNESDEPCLITFAVCGDGPNTTPSYMSVPTDHPQKPPNDMSKIKVAQPRTIGAVNDKRLIKAVDGINRGYRRWRNEAAGGRDTGTVLSSAHSY